MAACSWRLAARSLHDPLDVIVQDALGVFLMSVSQQRTTVGNVSIAQVVMLGISTRGEPVTGQRCACGNVDIITLLLLS